MQVYIEVYDNFSLLHCRWRNYPHWILRKNNVRRARRKINNLAVKIIKNTMIRNHNKIAIPLKKMWKRMNRRKYLRN